MNYQGKIWTQTDGTSIGKSISGDIAAIYMEFYENEYIFDPKKNAFIPIFWVREVDDDGNIVMKPYPFFLLT